MKFTKFFILSLLFLLVINSMVHSMNKPFPQNVEYEHCTQPSHAKNTMAQDIYEYYEYWKEKYLTPAGSTIGGYYIKTTGSTSNALTVSEAHGYGMMTFALMAGSSPLGDPNAKNIFDGMFKVFDEHPSRYSDDLMAWAFGSDGNGGETFGTNTSAATDGDLDIAYALLLAHTQWGSKGTINYLEEAIRVINAIKKYEMNEKNGMVMIADNLYWADPNLEESDCPSIFYLSRCSDWMPDHFRAFKEATGDDFWTIAIDTVYSVYNQIINQYSPVTALTPGFVNYSNHSPYAYGNNDENLNFTYDACRVPWRIATDFAHYKESAPKVIIEKISSWIMSSTSNDPWEVKGSYKLNGDPMVTWGTACFTGPMLTACMVDKSSTSLDYIDEGWNVLTYDKEDYYEDSIKLLCMLLLTGNWWKPELSTTPISNHNPMKNNLQLSIIPNRITNTIEVSYSLKNSCNIEFNLYSMNGKRIYHTTTDANHSGINKMNISFNNKVLSTGVYYGELITQDKRLTTKVNFLK